MGIDLRKEGGARGDGAVQSQKRPPRRAAPLRFRFYLGGAVAVHLTAAAGLIYGLYLLHPFLLVLFLLGVGLEMNRVRHHLLSALYVLSSQWARLTQALHVFSSSSVG
jgi:hypothetical protein